MTRSCQSRIATKYWCGIAEADALYAAALREKPDHPGALQKKLDRKRH